MKFQLTTFLVNERVPTVELELGAFLCQWYWHCNTIYIICAIVCLLIITSYHNSSICIYL